ncbi:hypothetical protein GCM10007939_24460 [Amylibacter marinus]|uniref:Phytanoyl-CoA dioxygenase (PhyH) n=1 Tax=Amylibacter marinus TaxID=1475483 RepID=A0ABQ5VXK1_9RHOB|nr:TIGR02466 family protein [Amylibacter marinus]GLQ36162.1 hypothetical protein GCM10007939_24460 [Amylibacter marinus]
MNEIKVDIEENSTRAEEFYDSVEVSENLYFPTQIFAFQLPDAVEKEANRLILEAIYAERDRDTKGIQRSNFKALGGWHSHNNLHREKVYKPLVRLIDSCSRSLSAQNNFHADYSLKIGSMWSIINPPGSSNRAHIHPGCQWSGVYYVQTPKNSGNIDFTDPRTQNLMTPPRYAANTKRRQECWSKVNFTPKGGKLLIFPSWLYHSVAPNLATEKGPAGDRVIISFNLAQEKD